MTERRLKPPVIHILFNPDAHNFTPGDIKKSFDSAERLDRSVLIAAAVRPSRIIIAGMTFSLSRSSVHCGRLSDNNVQTFENRRRRVA